MRLNPYILIRPKLSQPAVVQSASVEFVLIYFVVKNIECLSSDLT
jgi:hypothetical protein